MQMMLAGIPTKALMMTMMMVLQGGGDDATVGRLQVKP